MDKPKITPKDFFLWLAAMAFFYVSLFAFVALIFSYLDYTYPDALSNRFGDPYSAGISYYMATLIVLFPIFLVLMRVIHKTIEADSTRRDVWVRRWALYLTLFVAGVTVAGDLITLLMYFFDGNVTLRFGLKVLLILLVAGGGFLHFLADLRGYWERNASQARLLSFAMGALVIITIVSGFFIVGTPWEARFYRFDEQKVGDLQTIQTYVFEHWRVTRALPTDTISLNNPLTGIFIPTDSQTGEAYEYTIKSPLSFELCATFNTEAQKSSSTKPMRLAPVAMDVPQMADGNDVWRHSIGRTCFTRVIDPKLYPEFPKTVY